MPPLAEMLLRELQERPQQFAEAADSHRDVSWPHFLLAWGELRAANLLQRDEDGRYLLQSPPATKQRRAKKARPT